MDNNLINIKSYPKPKKEGGGNANITYNINGADIGSNLKLKSLQVNRIMSDYIETNNIDAGTGNFVYLVASDGTISSLRGDNLDYNSGRIGDFKSDNIETNKLNVKDTATITNIFNNYLNSKEIVTDYLTVNKAAHFFEVVVDKIRSVGGTIINTATSCVIDYVEPYYGDGLSAPLTGYKCYWKQTNNEDDYVSNDWLVGDQAISQNCNLVAGVNHNTSNHYYWRLVSEVSNSTKYVNFDTGETSDGELVDGEYVAPQYKVQFKGIVNGQNFNGFKYDNGLTGEDKLVVDSWNITSQIDGDWNSANEILTVEDTLHGLQLIPNDINNRYPNIRRGSFTFRTTQPTRLNVMILFDNDTVEYHPSTEQQNDYNIQIVNPNNALINMIVITSDVVDVWHACHWIVLSNMPGEKDVPTGDFATEVDGWDDVPAKGDNIAQLGYRYTELSSADLIKLGYDSSSEDAAGQSLTTPYNNATNKQAWKDSHIDEVSRASAIVIAAYKTPDSGGTINGRTIQPIKPPSYAQYQDITDFNLFTHRGTYMDSSGTYIKGNLVSSSGDIINIDDTLTVDVDYYGLICNESPVTKPSSGNKTVEFNVLHVLNGTGDIMTNAGLENWYITVNNGQAIVVESGDNYFEYTISSSTSATSLDVKLYDVDNNLKDNIIVSIIDLGSVTDGVNGSYDKWMYACSRGDTPTGQQLYTCDFIPTGDGWRTDPDYWNPLAADEYVWMSSGHVTGLVGGWTYSHWSDAVKLTGDNGQDGEDGSITEFIYTRNNTGIAPTAPVGTYAPDWPNTDGLSPTGVDNYGTVWSDNPQGVSPDMQYEYMCQRTKKAGATGYEAYQPNPAALWSKYGENGRDGDGVEYIFARTTGPTGPAIFQRRGDSSIGATYINYEPEEHGLITSWYDGNISEWRNQDKREYLPPNVNTYGTPSTTWTDDPQGVTGAYTYEWVSQRKYNGETKKWEEFSEPAIWAEAGREGVTGVPGQNGDNGIVDKLIPVVQQWEVRTTSTDDYVSIQSLLYTDLQYQIFHVDGDVVSQVTGNGLDAYTVTATVKSLTNSNLHTYTLTKSNNMFVLSFTNMLSDIFSATNKHDYRKLSQSSNADADLPIEMNVKLSVGSDVVDSKTIEVIFKAGHIFTVTDDALNTAFFGGWTGPSGTYINGMSTLWMGVSGINTNVSTLQTWATGMQSDYSTFKQTATQFETRVESDYYVNTPTGLAASITYSIIDERANSIGLNVYNNIEGELYRTGIDITGITGPTGSTGGTITLRAANTLVDGQLNVLGNFISDDSLTLNKIVADVDSGGLKLYGPSKIDEHGEVQSGATYKEIINIGFSDADENRQRTGFININQYDKNVIPRSGITGASHRMLIEPTNGGIWMAGQNNTNINKLNINEYDINCIEYDSNGDVVGTYHKSWPELLQYNRIIRYDGTSEGQYGQIVADADYDYFFITNNTNPITLNISSTLFAEGRVIHIKGQNGTIIDNGNGNIVLKSGAWNHTNNTNAATSWTFPIKQKCFVYNNLDIKQSDYILTESYSISLMRYGTQWLEI